MYKFFKILTLTVFNLFFFFTSLLYSEEKIKIDSEQQKLKIDKSLFKRFLNNGFDGISTNPNYKMLALLIILLINLSLFFVIGNMGKAFLRNAGIMG